MRAALRVLVVEDDADFRALVCQLLRDAGHDPVDVADAEAGLLQVGKGRIDVALCDYFLPGRNGVTFLREVRAHHPQVRCLAMTGHPDPFILGRGHDDGYFVITKPLDPALLLALIDSDVGLAPAATLSPSVVEAAAHS